MAAKITQTFTDSGLMLDTPQDVPVSSKSLHEGQALQVKQPGKNFCAKLLYCEAIHLSSKPNSVLYFS